MNDNTYLKDVCTQKEAIDAACDILERCNNITIEKALAEIDNAHIVYDSLYSSFEQRRRALRNIKVYTEILTMLKRRTF